MKSRTEGFVILPEPFNDELAFLRNNDSGLDN